jgi:hypothetical protein
MVAGLHVRDCRAYVHYLAEHFVPDDEFRLTIGSLGSTSGYLFPVGATDTHPDHSDLDFTLCGDRRLWPFHQTRTGSTRNNSDSFHEVSIPCLRAVFG